MSLGSHQLHRFAHRGRCRRNATFASCCLQSIDGGRLPLPSLINQLLLQYGTEPLVLSSNLCRKASYSARAAKWWLTNGLALLLGPHGQNGAVRSCYVRNMATIAGSNLRRSSSEIATEIHARLGLVSSETEHMLLHFRALPIDHPKRFELLRRLEVGAAICAELADLLGLIEGKVDRTDHTTAEPPAGDRPPRRRGRPRFEEV